MGKLKYSLISLLAVCLTAGGVFAAWSFSEGSIENPESPDVNISTEGLGGMEFDYISVKFDANEETYSGACFDNNIDITEKTITSKKGQSVNAPQYLEKFPNYNAFPSCGDRVFSHRSTVMNADVNDPDEYFTFDVGFSTDVTLYAQYVDKTNPAIYKKYSDTSFELMGYLTKHSGTQWHIKNFIVEEMAHYSTETRSYSYTIEYNDIKYDLKSVSNSSGYLNSTYKIQYGKDYVVKGLYNVFFDPNKVTYESADSGTLGWILYGGKAYFQPLYNYRLKGNPVADGDDGWTSNKNQISFRWSHDDGDQKVYVIDKVYFPKYTPTTSREFKPYISHFDVWPLRDINYNDADSISPKMYVSGDSNPTGDVIYAGSEKGSNLKIKDDATATAYQVTLYVDYGRGQPFEYYWTNTNHEYHLTFEKYPIKTTIEVKPYKHTISIYDKKGGSLVGEPIDITSNGVWDEYNNSYPVRTHESITKKYQGIARRDYYTNEIIDFSSLNINKSYHIYPVYEENDALTYDLILSVVEGGKYIDVPIAIYEGKKVSDSIDYYLNHETDDKFDNLINKYLNPDYNIPSDPISDNYLSNMSYKFDGYVSGSTLSDDVVPLSKILDSSLKMDTTYKARYISTKEVLKYYTANSNTYKWVSPNDVASSPTYDLNKEITVYKYNGVALETGTYLYSSNRFDFSVEPSSHDILTSGAVIFPTFNGDSWTFYRVVLEKIGKADYKGSSATFAIYAFGSGEEWYRPVNGPGSTLNARFYIDIKYPKIIFCRMDSSGKNDWANKWNQSGDIIISDFYFAGNTNIEYTVWYW